MSIDTACSSSLVGTHLAATSFLSADCPRALVCGVNLTMRAETTAVLSKAGMLAQVTPQSHLSAEYPMPCDRTVWHHMCMREALVMGRIPVRRQVYSITRLSSLQHWVQDGRCKTLDAAADGYMRGEGCIVHLLQAFQPEELVAAHLVNQAAVLHGTAVNQDGRSSSLTVRYPPLVPLGQHDVYQDGEPASHDQSLPVVTTFSADPQLPVAAPLCNRMVMACWHIREPSV